MKILKNGNIPHYMAICPKCCCEFEFTKKETESMNGIISFIECPWCGFNVSDYDWKEVK